MTPTVSVVIPSYNHAPYILDAVNSVLSQSFEDLELLVVDDGSQDESVKLLQSVSDPRMRLILQENQGAHNAINRGLRLAQGRYLAVLNSDDRFLPERLSTAISAFAGDKDLALVGSYIEVIDQAGNRLGLKEGYHNLDPWPVPNPSATFKADGDLRTALLMQNYWSTTSNYVLPREIYEQYGPYLPLRYVHDWDFALRILRERPAKLIEKPLLQYRVHNSNTISSNRVAMIFEICWILAVHLPIYLREPWFWQLGEERRAEQIKHSIYVYDCDAVFWKILTYIHYGPAGSAMVLLQEDHPVRHQYLEEIQQILDTQAKSADTAASTDVPKATRFGRLRSVIQKILT